MVKDSNTEQRIIGAARRVFMRSGMAGARMQEIADEAGINKALLHYYFRSKEKLFDYILTEVIEKLASGIRETFSKDLTVKERLNSFVDVYIDVLLENKYLPLFILNEINHNPESFIKLLKDNMVIHMGKFFGQVQDEAARGIIRPVHPLHLLLNTVGLIIFPFAVFPVISGIAGPEMEGLLNNFLEERKLVVKDFINNALTPSKS